jgi:hypothetical protein
LAGLLGLRPIARRHRGRAIGALIVFLGGSLATSSFWFGGTWILFALAILSMGSGPSPQDTALKSPAN